MVYFQTKNPNYDKFWRSLEWKMLVHFMVIWNILRPYLGIFYGHLEMSWAFDMLFPVVVYFVKKNLAILQCTPLKNVGVFKTRRWSGTGLPDGIFADQK
jgi:hypothetical protein